MSKMKKSDWMLIGYIGTILGVLFLFGALFCFSYSEIRSFIITVEVYPYREYAGTLLASGIILLVIGVGCLWRAEQEMTYKKEPSSTPPPKPIPRGIFCSNCGKLVSVEAKFCPNCGKELKTN